MRRILRKPGSRFLKVFELFVADAHSWLWYLAEDDRLGDEAKDIFEKTDDGDETVILPGIAVAESIYVVGSHGYGVELSKIIEDLKKSRNYRMRSMDYQKVSQLVEDDRDLSIHDKIIVITAEQLEADIISKDEEIRSSANQNVLW